MTGRWPDTAVHCHVWAVDDMSRHLRYLARRHRDHTEGIPHASAVHPGNEEDQTRGFSGRGGVSEYYLQTISGGLDYQNSNIKKVGGINLKQICKINILAHDTGAEK